MWWCPASRCWWEASSSSRWGDSRTKGEGGASAARGGGGGMSWGLGCGVVGALDSRAHSRGAWPRGGFSLQSPGGKPSAVPGRAASRSMRAPLRACCLTVVAAACSPLAARRAGAWTRCCCLAS